MSGDLDTVIGELRNAQRIIICSHEKPDGDALGASLGMGLLLKMLGKEVGLGGYSPLSSRYGFLAEFMPLEVLPEDPQLLLVVDCGDVNRIELRTRELAKLLPVVNIDHHISNTNFGRANWVDPQASSAGEMVCRLAAHAAWPLPPAAATPLWVAITTDTGDFRYSNTNPEVLRIAANLLEMGVRPHLIKRELSDSLTIGDIALQRRILERLTVDADGALGYICLSEKDFSELDCGPENMHDPVNVALSIKSVCVAACMYEVPGENKVKLSLRSYEPLDAAAFCGRFGGGGHPRAAGCSFENQRIEAVKEQVLPQLKKFALSRR